MYKLKILILGTGYVGSEIASSLSKNHIVTCIDHGNNFSDFSGKLENIKLVKGEIQNKNLIKEFSKEIIALQTLKVWNEAFE